MNRLAGLPELPELVSVRIAGRLGMDFFHSYLRIIGDGHELTDGLLLLSIGQANVEHLDREDDPAARHADIADPPPLEALRPISVNAVAGTLRIPFETVRRRVNRLVATRACLSTPRGVLLPAQTWSSEQHRFRVFAVHQHLRNLYFGLQDLRILRPTRTRSAPERLPLLAVDRLAASYTLRQLNALATHFGDVDLGLLVLQVIRLTTDHLDDTYTEFTQRDDLVTDTLRRPVAVSTLASRLGASGETIRRHAHELTKRGWLARDAKGAVYLTREMLREPRWAAARQENVANLNRLFTGLADAGVLSIWDRAA